LLKLLLAGSRWLRNSSFQLGTRTEKLALYGLLIAALSCVAGWLVILDPQPSTSPQNVVVASSTTTKKIAQHKVRERLNQEVGKQHAHRIMTRFILFETIDDELKKFRDVYDREPTEVEIGQIAEKIVADELKNKK
jgi:hypothetical protein